MGLDQYIFHATKTHYDEQHTVNRSELSDHVVIPAQEIDLQIYETGIEMPEILGSGSSFSSVITTTDENEAFQAYRSGSRNYLLRATYSIDRPRIIERWDKEQECWRT